MKVNSPVTQREVLLKKGSILVSRTDLKGVITYVNDEFVAISGFTRAELIGASHNIVRHPDMPPAAFEDMWLNLKALRPWQGLVKNRTQSGDFYWVDANAIPVFKNGMVCEYLSVRRAPSREQIEHAEQLYRRLNNDPQAVIRPTGLAVIVKAIKEMAVCKKIAAAGALLLLPITYLLYLFFLARDYGLIAGTVLLAVMATALACHAVGTLTTTLNNSIGVFYRLAEKKFGNVQALTRNDLIGDFLRALYSMEVNLNLELARARDEATKYQRISQALDDVQSGIMMANTDFEIIYINNSAARMFKAAEQDIRKQLPHFNADKLLGANIDHFHKVPDHQRRMLADLKAPYQSDLLIAGQHLHVVASPVISSDGERIGYVAEWQNRTPEVLIEQEIGRLVEAIKAGDLSSRIDMAGKYGYAKTLSSGINELTDVIENAFNDINRVMAAMAQGDVSRVITNDYQGAYAQCKNNINHTLSTLNDFITQISDAADFIASASQQIAQGNDNLSQRAEQQAANLEQTAASMEQLAGTVRNNANNTQQVNQEVHSATACAQQGGKVVNSAIVAMQDINDSSNKIAEIITVIDEIAFQTNLLALNASVEAARAGEHGRGFSVVATEVRNLAQRSANAAQQSEALIQNSVQKVRAGTAFVNETGAAFHEIVTSVGQVGALVAQIASASTEQTTGIDQVNQAIAQMDEMTQQNAALAEQAAAASIAMSNQASHMTELLSFFKTGSKGTAAPIRTFERAKAPPALPKKPAAPALALASSQSESDNGDIWEAF